MLPADDVLDNYTRQVRRVAFSYVEPKVPKHPKLIHASKEVANLLGISNQDLVSDDFLKIFSGAEIHPETTPYAMAYAGHQFGNWAGQLGDGRAINLFEVLHNNKQYAVQLKGAGKTPYSRRGDGLAVLRSSIREYLCSEAMHHLGVPTTRALSLALSGDEVLRDMLYNGNSAFEKGAIVCRVAPSFIRFGNFELFASRGDVTNLKRLTDYVIQQFYPFLGTPSKDTYISFFNEVTQRTLKMIIHWQRVGFVHGVMNTDNMSILGYTIDYGPYGWLEGYDYGWTPNTTDAQNKRYRYGNQPNIALWNLLQLANALYPLVEDAKPFENILNNYKKQFDIQYLQMMCQKIGLKHKAEKDHQLIQDLEACLLLTETDMTLFFRQLSQFKNDQPAQGLSVIESAFYHPQELTSKIKNQWINWFEAYHNRLKKETQTNAQRQNLMNTVNPKYVLRNYMAQLAIDAANEGDYKLLEDLFQLLKKPYQEQPQQEKWYAKRPEWARHKVGCSMLSCSS
mgnify:CR=1 FL=1